MRAINIPPESPNFQRDQLRLLRVIDNIARRAQAVDEEYEPKRLILQDSVTGTRYVVSVQSGSLTLTAI